MKTRILSITYVASTLLLLIAVPVSAANLVMGSISDEPAEELKSFQPVADYIAARLQSAGVGKGSVVIGRSINHMAQLIRNGKVDLYIDSPFPTLEVAQLSGVRPQLRRWKKGISTYHSVVFVRKDSGIREPSDLQGRVVAFEEPFSTSAYFLPKASLSKLGFNLVEVAGPAEAVSANDIGYTFTDDDENTLFWVMRKRSPAGAMSAGSLKKLAKKQMKKLSVIHTTIDVPRHVVSFRSDLDLGLVQKIMVILLHMHESPEGRQVLLDFGKTTRFDKFPGGPDAALKKVRELGSYIKLNSSD